VTAAGRPGRAAPVDPIEPEARGNAGLVVCGLGISIDGAAKGRGASRGYLARRRPPRTTDPE
jgi:hypothetical protein